jgi:hypothetical protein
MAWSGAGVFSRLYNWVADKNNLVNITASRMDAEMDGFATGIQACVAKNGENSATANLPMGGFRHSGVHASSGQGARSEYTSTATIQDGAVLKLGTVGGTANALTANLSPAITAYAAGQRFTFVATATNTGATTLAVNGIASPKDIKVNSSAGVAACVGGEIINACSYEVFYDGTQFILQNPTRLPDALTLGATATLTSTDAGATAGPTLTLYRDSASPAANDVLGSLIFAGEDSAGNATTYANIDVSITDATNGSEDGRLRINTIKAGLVTEQVSITSVGDVGIGQTVPGAKLEVGNADSGKGAFVVDQNTDTVAASVSHAGQTTTAFFVNCENTSYNNANGAARIIIGRGAASDMAFLKAESNAGGDVEFHLRGDGTGFCDGSWTGGGADYAEYFESTNGQAIQPGTSVVLVGDKVRAATPQDATADIVGVVRPFGTSAALGNAGALRWSGKYERDEFGAYKLDRNGERQLSKSFDPTQTYVPREKRAEWVIVGLMGQIPVGKNQPKGDRWRKMRDVSASVEMWFVR